MKPDSPSPTVGNGSLRPAEIRSPGASSGPPVSKGSDPSTAGVNPHVHHAREHLERIRNGITHLPRPELVFLGEEGDDFFWELIGFRLSGHPSLVFGAVRFPRLDLPGVDHGRESLASFLTAPTVGPGGFHAPPGAFPVFLPRSHETIPRFLRGLRAGRRPAPVYLETIQIELAFDLRLSSPAALEVLRQRAAPLSIHLFRTARGHVLRGYSHGPLGGPNLRQRFMSVRDAEQLTPGGRYRLPALVLNRSFVTLTADVDDRETDLAAAHWVPFASASATGTHLLAG